MRTHLNRRAGSRALVAAAMVGLVVGMSACGGGKKADTTTAASGAEQWAGSVCSAFTTWKTSLQNIKSGLQETGLAGLSSSELRQAGRQAEDATQTLTKSLKQLGAPSTTGSETAKESLTTLENSLSDGVSTISSTLNQISSPADAITAIPTVKTELTTMAGDLTTAVDQLKQADPGGELESAFHDAPSCSPYFSS